MVPLCAACPVPHAIVLFCSEVVTLLFAQTRGWRAERLRGRQTASHDATTVTAPRAIGRRVGWAGERRTGVVLCGRTVYRKQCRVQPISQNNKQNM